MKKLTTTVFLTFLLSSFTAHAAITEAEVIAAQQAWGEGIVTIGKAKDPKEAATKHLKTFYGFDEGTVLFKPTLASVDQFRGTQAEALSYFIGQDLAEDKGFALAPYTKVGWENEGIVINGDTAVSMGNYFFTKTDGKVVKAEYSLAYFKDEKGDLRINLHHSSLPYNP